MKIAIIGKMCSGKTTIANLIIDKDKSYKRLSFGQKVKDLAVELFNMKGKDRSLLINFANKMREIDSDVWVNYIINNNKDIDNCIIDDILYQNELYKLINNNFYIIKLNISKELQKERIIKTYPDNYIDHLKYINHFSENCNFKFKDGYPNLILDVDNLNLIDIQNIIYNII